MLWRSRTSIVVKNNMKKSPQPPLQKGEAAALYTTHQVFGLEIVAVSKDAVVKSLQHSLSLSKGPGSVILYTPNPEMILESRKNDEFLEVLQRADILVPDGIGLLWAARFLKLPLRFKGVFRWIWTSWQVFYSLLAIVFYPPFVERYISERIPGSELFWDVVRIASNQNKKIFLLGAGPGVAEEVRERTKAVYPDLEVSGVFSGNPDPFHDEHIQHHIRNASPDIVFVAYGAPKQELWIDRNASKLPGVKFWMGVGGTFDFVAGKSKRAPRLFRRFGLEWLFRLLIEPWRYLRIWNATVRFVRLVVRSR